MAIVVFLVIFLGGILLFPYIATNVPDGPQQVDWSLLEGFMGLLTVALIAGGSFFALFEYINSERQQKREGAETSFNIYSQIFNRLMNDEDTAARRWIILNIPVLQPEQDHQEWLDEVKVLLNQHPEGWTGDSPPGQAYLKRILNTLDFVGFVAENYWDMDNELVEWMSGPITKVWERIGPYIEDQAVQRKEPDYYRAARALSQYCMEWRKREGLPQSVIVRGST